MNRLSLIVAALLMGRICLAGGGEPSGEKAFVRSVVQSLIAGGQTTAFAVAEQVVAIDNGEVLSKEDFRRAWPEFAEAAFKRRISVDDFFAGVVLKIQPVADNKRLMGNKRLLKAYKHEQGDIYCDASHVKEGADDFIGYDKAFIYIIRHVVSPRQLT